MGLFYTEAGSWCSWTDMKWTCILGSIFTPNLIEFDFIERRFSASHRESRKCVWIRWLEVLQEGSSAPKLNLKRPFGGLPEQEFAGIQRYCCMDRWQNTASWRSTVMQVSRLCEYSLGFEVAGIFRVSRSGWVLYVIHGSRKVVIKSKDWAAKNHVEIKYHATTLFASDGDKLASTFVPLNDLIRMIPEPLAFGEEKYRKSQETTWSFAIECFQRFYSALSIY